RVESAKNQPTTPTANTTPSGTIGESSIPGLRRVKVAEIGVDNSDLASHLAPCSVACRFRAVLPEQEQNWFLRCLSLGNGLALCGQTPVREQLSFFSRPVLPLVS